MKFQCRWESLCQLNMKTGKVTRRKQRQLADCQVKRGRPGKILNDARWKSRRANGRDQRYHRGPLVDSKQAILTPIDEPVVVLLVGLGADSTAVMPNDYPVLRS
jgi:hypothetical protein